jgi:hypothetical protein
MEEESMKRFRQMISVGLLLLPLVVGAETISWLLPTTYVDNSAISAADQARITVYLRGWKAGNPGAKTYFGEARNGLTSWGASNDNTKIMNRMNEGAAANSVPGWVVLKPGDNVITTLSAALVGSDGVERDGPESPPYAWTIYKAPVAPLPPVVIPSCNPPTGISIKP